MGSQGRRTAGDATSFPGSLILPPPVGSSQGAVRWVILGTTLSGIARRKIWIQPLKETNQGVFRPFFGPLKDTTYNGISLFTSACSAWDPKLVGRTRVTGRNWAWKRKKVLVLSLFLRAHFSVLIIFNMHFIKWKLWEFGWTLVSWIMIIFYE